MTMQVTLDYFRYVIALVILLCAPPTLLIWLLIHPFISTWRRLGTIPSYGCFMCLMIFIAWSIWQWRRWLTGIEYGSNVGLWGLAILFICAAVFVGAHRKKHLEWTVVIGLPELAASHSSRTLVTDGIYSKTRNPRYLETILFVWGLAFFANYLAVYLALIVGLPILHVVILLEEHELTEAFGDVYLRYCRQVPRYIPDILH
jgi:hypothetical protein